MSIRSALAPVLVVLLSSSVVSAATLDSVNGRVLVNRGQGYGPGVAQSSLKPGDQVFATNGASARIVFDNLCFENVEAGQVITVRAGNPECAFDPTNAPGTEAGGISATTVLVGGAVVAAGVGAAILISRSGKPASP